MSAREKKIIQNLEEVEEKIATVAYQLLKLNREGGDKSPLLVEIYSTCNRISDELATLMEMSWKT